jgi:hypothetical protein
LRRLSSRLNFDYYQSVMAGMAPAPPAKSKKTSSPQSPSPQSPSPQSPSPQSKATPRQPAVAEGDEIVKSGSLRAERAYDEIARLAYNYWLDRKDTGEGSPEQDWLRAEEELRGDRPVR